jgi:hypothetical protein
MYIERWVDCNVSGTSHYYLLADGCILGPGGVSEVRPLMLAEIAGLSTGPPNEHRQYASY